MKDLKARVQTENQDGSQEHSRRVFQSAEGSPSTRYRAEEE